MVNAELSVRAILSGEAPADVPVTVKGWVRTRRDSKAGISFVHVSDVGGRVPSSVSVLNDSIFAEGLRIPPVKYMRRGVVDPSVSAMILANSRTPDANDGDPLPIGRPHSCERHVSGQLSVPAAVRVHEKAPVPDGLPVRRPTWTERAPLHQSSQPAPVGVHDVEGRPVAVYAAPVHDAGLHYRLMDERDRTPIR